MELKPGSRFACPGSTAQVIVVRGPVEPVEVTCSGHPLVEVGAADATGPEPDAATDSSGGELLVGKRYVDPDSGLELLCSASGPGTLTADGRTIDLKSAKPLPSSD